MKKAEEEPRTEWKLVAWFICSRTGGKMGFCFKLLLGNPFSAELQIRTRFQGGGNGTMGLSCCWGTILSYRRWIQGADKTAWLSCVALYHGEAAVESIIYPRRHHLWQNEKLAQEEGPRGCTAGTDFIQTSPVRPAPSCAVGCRSQVFGGVTLWNTWHGHSQIYIGTEENEKHGRPGRCMFLHSKISHRQSSLIFMKLM